MDYELEDVICQHCDQHIEKVTAHHGFVYDFFACPYCNEENRVH